MKGIHVIDKYSAKRYLSYFLIHTCVYHACKSHSLHLAGRLPCSHFLREKGTRPLVAIRKNATKSRKSCVFFYGFKMHMCIKKYKG